MLRINVTLPNGHHELLVLEKSSKVQDLRIAARHAFGQKILTLITATNHILVNPEESIEASLKDGDNLTGVVLQPQLAATDYAFAFWCHGHKTVTWGHGNFGGDSSEVKVQLWDVKEIQANVGAFAAILADRSVVTWGYFPMVVTAPQFKTSWGVYKRFRLQGPLSLQFWQIGQLLPGATHSLVGTVQKSKISSGMCSRFRPRVMHLRRFWQMDLLFLGAILPMVVSALQFKISWAFCSTGVCWMQICKLFVLNDLIYRFQRSCDFWKVQFSQVHLVIFKFWNSVVDIISLDVD